MLLDLDTGERRPDLLDDFADIFSVRKADWRWHPPRHLYGVEYVWLVERVVELLGADLAGLRIMDAGGGGGAPQYWLAMHGAEVVNVSRGHGPLVGTTRSGRTLPATRLVTAGLEDRDALVRAGLSERSMDAVVSVSAIEHNEPEVMARIVDNMLWLLRPGAPCIVTVPAGRTESWHPRGMFPGHPEFPEVLLFDRDTVADLAQRFGDVAELISPLDDRAAYDRRWDAIKADMDGHPGHRCPYLSAGFVFRRRG